MGCGPSGGTAAGKTAAQESAAPAGGDNWATSRQTPAAKAASVPLGPGQEGERRLQSQRSRRGAEDDIPIVGEEARPRQDSLRDGFGTAAQLPAATLQAAASQSGPLGQTSPRSDASTPQAGSPLGGDRAPQGGREGLGQRPARPQQRSGEAARRVAELEEVLPGSIAESPTAQRTPTEALFRDGAIGPSRWLNNREGSSKAEVRDAPGAARLGRAPSGGAGPSSEARRSPDRSFSFGGAKAAVPAESGVRQQPQAQPTLTRQQQEEAAKSAEARRRFDLQRQQRGPPQQPPPARPDPMTGGQSFGWSTQVDHAQSPTAGYANHVWEANKVADVSPRKEQLGAYLPPGLFDDDPDPTPTSTQHHQAAKPAAFDADDEALMREILDDFDPP